jgi:hypothetical protein
LRRAILGYYREDLYLVPPSEAGQPADIDNDGDDPNAPDVFP